MPSTSATRRLTVADQLFAEGFRFDFFQAVRLLEKLASNRRPVGRQGTLARESVRFRVPASLVFPPSAILKVDPPADTDAAADMWVNFMGLTGPSGILPRHYTEMLVRRHIDFRGDERYVLRDWLDLFNHRLISLFHRAWEKYRFWVAFDRGDHLLPTPDTFTAAFRGLLGLAPPPLRNRLRVSVSVPATPSDTASEKVLARIDDVSLVRYAGLITQRPRNTANLEAVLTDYFLVPVRVEQFKGQWLRLEPDDQLKLGTCTTNAQLGRGAVVGPRVWNVQAKFRIRLGPLTYQQFCEFFPDPAPLAQRKMFFLLSQLVRLYAGPEFDFDVQLVVRRQEVPPTHLAADTKNGSRLGWNTWLYNRPPERDAADAVIAGDERRSFPEAGI